MWTNAETNWSTDRQACTSWSARQGVGSTETSSWGTRWLETYQHRASSTGVACSSVVGSTLRSHMEKNCPSWMALGVQKTSGVSENQETDLMPLSPKTCTFYWYFLGNENICGICTTEFYIFMSVLCVTVVSILLVCHMFHFCNINLNQIILLKMLLLCIDSFYHCNF